jgi:hypothetical protein
LEQGKAWHGMAFRPGQKEEMSMQQLKEVTEALASALETMIQRGLKPPIYCVIVGSNGSIMASHYVPHEVLGLDCHMVAEHTEGEGLFRCPINVFFSDSSGRAEKVIIEVQ